MLHRQPDVHIVERGGLQRNTLCTYLLSIFLKSALLSLGFSILLVVGSSPVPVDDSAALVSGAFLRVLGTNCTWVRARPGLLKYNNIDFNLRRDGYIYRR